MTRKDLDLVCALVNVKKGTINANTCSIIEERFNDIPSYVIEELKEKMPWGSIILRDYGELSNNYIGKYLFSLEDEKYDPYRYSWITQTIAREYRIKLKVISEILLRNREDEIDLIFSYKKLVDDDWFVIYDDIPSIYLDYCKKRDNQPHFNLLAKIHNLSYDILKKYQDDFNWKIISEYHDLDDDFLFRFYDKLNMEILSKRVEV